MNRGIVAGSIVALVSATIGLITAFGVTITALQHDAILGFVSAVIVVAPLVGAAYDHTRHTVAARIEASYVVADREAHDAHDAAGRIAPCRSSSHR